LETATGRSSRRPPSRRAPSFSFLLDGADEAQFDAIWAGLAEGGTALMPVADYGWSQKFGWLNDRFGVSWQINLP
jgi:uncharacterized glyoxalase superfamily protein PhnB